MHAAQRGASLVEFTVILPTLLVTTLGVWQSALVFHAKSHLNYATFEAARAGTVSHASVASVTEGLTKGLVAYYGGGLDTNELTKRYAEVAKDVAASTRVEYLSPVKESFDDYQSPAVRDRLKAKARAIPNLGIGYMQCPHDRPDCASDPRTNRSGQTLSDANLLKLRITYGIPKSKQLPLVGRFYTWALKTTGAGSGDAFKKKLLDDGRIPLVTHVTLRMQSEPIEHASMISRAGPGNNGSPHDPRKAHPPSDPPAEIPPPTSRYGDDGGADHRADDKAPPKECPPNHDVVEDLASDVLFAFDSATLTPAGKGRLDRLLEDAREQDFDSLEITGYTDQLGSSAHNATLSLARAKAVSSYLKSKGFTKPINVAGRGSADPLVSLATCPAERQAQINCLAPNRRVSIKWQR
jgi:outer membrane protein OmpA-like peptidoglycan-associated protein